MPGVPRPCCDPFRRCVYRPRGPGAPCCDTYYRKAAGQNILQGQAPSASGVAAEPPSPRQGRATPFVEVTRLCIPGAEVTSLMAQAMPSARVEWVGGGHLISPATPPCSASPTRCSRAGRPAATREQGALRRRQSCAAWIKPQWSTLPACARPFVGTERSEDGWHNRDDRANGHTLLAGIVRTLLSVIERTGEATAAEVDADTLQSRLRDELAGAQAISRTQLSRAPRPSSSESRCTSATSAVCALSVMGGARPCANHVVAAKPLCAE